MSTSPRRSRSPALARAMPAELHHLPQADRLGIQRLHDAIQTTNDWRAIAGSLELAARILEKTCSLPISDAEIQKFQTLISTVKEECKQLKTVAHFRLFDNMDAIDKQVDNLAKHRDGSSFIVSRDGVPGLSEALEEHVDEVKPQTHLLFFCVNPTYLHAVAPPRGPTNQVSLLRRVGLSDTIFFLV